MGLFAEWQPQYAEVDVPSFPVVNKRPAIQGYLNVGLPGSRALASKFSEADAFGISLIRSKITVLDVDTPDENVLIDAMDRFGPSPFVVRSGSGNWHAWYRNSGGGRRIRPLPNIDILAAGFVVVPPSLVANGGYTIVQGSLDDLPNLPAMAGQTAEIPAPITTPSPLSSLPRPLPVEGPSLGERNTALWTYLMTQSPYYDGPDALIDVARAQAAAFASPLPDDEVVKTALSAWKYEADDKNWIARGRRRPSLSEPDGLFWEHPDAFMVWKALRHFNAGRSRFFIANEMAKSMPRKAWDRERFSAARKVLLDLGFIVLVRRASTGNAAVYAWGRS